jgi:hypothetical protein
VVINHTANGNMALFNGESNYSFSGVEKPNYNTVRGQAPKNIISSPPSIETYGRTNMVEQQSNVDNRIDPTLLNAFKANPYTFSLSSVA